MGMAEAMLLAKVVEINEKDKKNKEGNNVWICKIMAGNGIRLSG
jgi:hypothetical protein